MNTRFKQYIHYMGSKQINDKCANTILTGGEQPSQYEY